MVAILVVISYCLFARNTPIAPTTNVSAAVCHAVRGLHIEEEEEALRLLFGVDVLVSYQVYHSAVNLQEWP